MDAAILRVDHRPQQWVLLVRRPLVLLGGRFVVVMLFDATLDEDRIVEPIGRPGLRAVVGDVVDLGDAGVVVGRDDIGQGVQFGNFINVPLFGALVPQGRTVFVDPDAGFTPFPNQWDILAQAKRVKESLLDEIIEINDLGGNHASANPAAHKGQPSSSFHGLLPCAQRMLAEGVTGYQRIACFRLAIQLKKVGLPLASTVAVLLDWASRNRPANGKRKITETEVREQTTWAYLRNYRSCGCEEPAIAAFCDRSCPLSRPEKDGSSASSSGLITDSNVKGALDEDTRKPSQPTNLQAQPAS